MTITLPKPCLVLLIGASGAGKSTFAKRHFLATEILSSDFCRGLVCDNEDSQAASGDAFEVLYLILEKRLGGGRTTVVDATNVQAMSRTSLMAVAKKYGVAVVGLVFLMPEEVCQRYNRQRPKRRVPAEVIRDQIAALAIADKGLEAEGFEAVYRFGSQGAVDGVYLT